jgi:hypothetical protein
MPSWVDKVSGNANKGNRKPKPQDDFYMGRFITINVGTIAIFGLEDPDLIDSLASKFALMSEQPKPVVISRMGEDVPIADPPSETDDRPAQQAFHAIEFGHVETMNFKYVFLILELKSDQSKTGEPAYAYVNVRADRLGSLLMQGKSGKLFNLPDFSTIVMTGHGEIPSEVSAKAQRDYLFGVQQTNVRLFPPLNEVT